jgi:hypothetical protein
MSVFIGTHSKKELFISVSAIFLLVPLLLVLAAGWAWAAAASQRTFMSSDDAVSAMIDAARSDNTRSLLAIFGPGSKDLVSSGDEVADKEALEHFVGHYDEAHRLESIDDRKVILHIGNDDWPFPIPVIRTGKGWHFDTKAGKHEILARRIGRNELDAMKVCLVYVDAQHEYALKDRDKNGLLEYAQKFMSDPGKKNGLYWKAGDGEEQSPLGPLIAEATGKGYGPRRPAAKPSPYKGYYYRILKAQGKSAAGGAYDYLVEGKMIGGFALVAYPAKYGNSGVMTFIVNQDGVVYQKNLGKNTTEIANAITRFDPDKTWQKAEQS